MDGGSGEREQAQHRTVSRFPIRVGRKSQPLLWLFGVTPDRAEVRLEGGKLIVRFGWWGLSTPIANISRWTIEGPFRWITAIGVRRSVRHGDVTFGGSTHGGVRMDFRGRVPWLGGLARMPATYVTVDDLEGLAAELGRLGIPGRDARRQSAPSVAPAAATDPPVEPEA